MLVLGNIATVYVAKKSLFSVRPLVLCILAMRDSFFEAVSRSVLSLPVGLFVHAFLHVFASCGWACFAGGGGGVQGL